MSRVFGLALCPQYRRREFNTFLYDQGMANKAVVLSVVVGLLASSSPAAGLKIGPDADLCAALSQVQPGEELLLQPGEYRGGCGVRRDGFPGRRSSSGRPILTGAHA
jgi:hypothetical protein